MLLHLIYSALFTLLH